ncbi:MAG: YceI family protein [Coraliomargaritaceae bacterium]
MIPLNKFYILAIASIFTLSASNAAEETYQIDTSHSSVSFSIRHFVAKTTGSFNQFSGTIYVDTEDMTRNRVEASITVGSIDTASEKRDAHLNADDYFHSDKFPLIEFKSTVWTTTEKNEVFSVTGELTMLGVTKEVVLEVTLLGFGPGRNGAHLSGWEATTSIDRTEWGLTAGAPAVGDEVSITILIEAVRQ